MKCFRELPDVSSRRKWQPIMNIFSMKAENNYHFFLFQSLVVATVSTFVVWAVTFYVLYKSGINGVPLYYEHLDLFWLTSGSIINFLVIPYYTWKGARLFGFKRFDFLGEYEFGQRQQGKRKKVLKVFPFFVILEMLTIQFGWVKGSLILDWYKVDDWFVYTTVSLVVGFIMSVAGGAIPHLIFATIQYKYFFQQISNQNLHDTNSEGEWP